MVHVRSLSDFLALVLLEVLLLCFVGLVRYCDHLTGEERAVFFAFHSFVACVLFSMFCFLFLMVSVVGCFL